MASTLNHFNANSSQYFTNEFCNPIFNTNTLIDFGKLSNEKTVFDAASIYLTFESMKQVNRPEGDDSWEYYDSSQDIAWKTGTSFGFRDAWAIGTTKDYVVGIWVGNADGEGRPGLVGVQTAAPILFDVFDLLPKSNWFAKPYDEMLEVSICKKSGYRASTICDDTEMRYIQASGKKTQACPFHKLVHLDSSEQYQVNSSCEAISNITNKAWFILPPLQAYYYKTKNPFYKPLPPYRSDCAESTGVSMEFIYPNQQSTIYLPKDFDGKTNDLILKVALSKPELELYWYIDNQYIGSTKDIHDMAILPSPGEHIITVTDQLGNELKHRITISE
jgi:penicillin-binding protein 1C